MSKAQRHLKWAVYVATLVLCSFGCAPIATPAASFSPSASVINDSPEPPETWLSPSPSVPTPLPSRFPFPEPSIQAGFYGGLTESLRFRCRGGYVDVYATIKNNSQYASSLIYFDTKSGVRTWVRLGKNTTKWFWTEDSDGFRAGIWSSPIWSSVEGRAIPPGSKATYSFTVIDKYPEQGVSALDAILVRDEWMTYGEGIEYESPC
jgi:hypothetical protein